MVKADFETGFLDKLPASLKDDMDRNLCTCMDVPRIEIISAIANGATTIEAIKAQTGATMGAGCCVQQIERLLEYLCAPQPRKRRKKSTWKRIGS